MATLTITYKAGGTTTVAYSDETLKQGLYQSLSRSVEAFLAQSPTEDATPLALSYQKHDDGPWRKIYAARDQVASIEIVGIPDPTAAAAAAATATTPPRATPPPASAPAAPGGDLPPGVSVAEASTTPSAEVERESTPDTADGES